VDIAQKRHSDDYILKLLREIEVKLSNRSDVQSAGRSVGISDATYYIWRKRFGGMGRSQLSEMRKRSQILRPDGRLCQRVRHPIRSNRTTPPQTPSK